MAGYRGMNSDDFVTSFAEEFCRDFAEDFFETKNTPAFIRKTGVFH